MSENKPILALVYDFDKTLCTKNMQEYSFIPKVNMAINEFWDEAKKLAKDKKMDSILSYMYLMIDKSKAEKISIHRADFVSLGQDLEFFPGVEEWFQRINILGNELGMEIQHYIISSGLREIIEGSSIFNNFNDVFACEFYYDENDVVCWPKNAVNYTTKTQFLFRINKGVLDISNDEDLNRYQPDDDRPIPFRNMIYIGDGLTDVPCMKLVKINGGYSIAVYPQDKKENIEELLKAERVDFLTPADYTEFSELDKIVRDILCAMSIVDSLKRKNRAQLEEIEDKNRISSMQNA